MRSFVSGVAKQSIIGRNAYLDWQLSFSRSGRETSFLQTREKQELVFSVILGPVDVASTEGELICSTSGSQEYLPV
jgi:hypothetical protein